MLFFFRLGSHWHNKPLLRTLPQTLRGWKRVSASSCLYIWFPRASALVDLDDLLPRPRRRGCFYILREPLVWFFVFMGKLAHFFSYYGSGQACFNLRHVQSCFKNKTPLEHTSCLIAGGLEQKWAKVQVWEFGFPRCFHEAYTKICWHFWFGAWGKNPCTTAPWCQKEMAQIEDVHSDLLYFLNPAVKPIWKHHIPAPTPQDRFSVPEFVPADFPFSYHIPHR